MRNRNKRKTRVALQIPAGWNESER